MKLICSTLTAPQSICLNKKLQNGTLQVTKRININGGANVGDKRTLLTPHGVVTELSDEDYKLLIETEWYKRMEKRGFVRPVETKDEAEDPSKKGMTDKDKSAQVTKDDYKKTGNKAKLVEPKEDDEVEL